MNLENGKCIQRVLSYFSYVLSGCFIFSPLHKSQNITFSLITMSITACLILIFFSYVFEKKKQCFKVPIFEKKFLSIIIPLIGIFSCLMLATETIKDTAYVASRGISFIYYLGLCLAILLLSLTLALGKDKGIYRFMTISAPIFIIVFFTMFFSLFTTKSFTFGIDSVFKKGIFDSAKSGFLSGTYFLCDTAIYLYCFENYYAKGSSKIYKKQLFYGLLSAIIFIISYNILCCGIFGQNLTRQISDPDFALIKLIPGIDFTEIVSAVRIISFIIKSSVYIYASSLLFSCVFPRFSENLIIKILFSAIPSAVIILMIFDTGLGYGAFQHLIYPTLFIFSSLFTIFFCIKEKNY